MSVSMPDVRRGRRCRGVMLIELIVGMVVGAIVAGVVYYAWLSVTQRVAADKASAVFYDQAQRMCAGLAARLRASDAVLSWDESGVRFVEGADTVDYRFDGEILYRNEEPVEPAGDNARVDRFSVRTRDPGSLETRGMRHLLVVTVVLADEKGRRERCEREVSVLTVSQAPEEDSEFDWGF